MNVMLLVGMVFVSYLFNMMVGVGVVFVFIVYVFYFDLDNFYLCGYWVELIVIMMGVVDLIL